MGSALVDRSRLSPGAAGISRAWAAQISEQAFELIDRKLLEPRVESQVPSTAAPTVALGDGAVGSETDLETKIDEPPLQTGSQPAGAELRQLLDSLKLTAMLNVGSTRVQPYAVLVWT